MHYWAGLQNEGERAALKQGAAALHATTLELHNNGRAERGRDVLMLEARDAEDDEDSDTDVDAHVKKC